MRQVPNGERKDQILAKTKPGRQKSTARKKTGRSHVARIIALIVGTVFLGLMTLMVEARHNNFYGTPLLQKMNMLAYTHLHGLPANPEKRARIESEIPNLNLLPPEAVLPKTPPTA